MIKGLEWDSHFFNLKIGEIELDQTVFSFEDNLYDLLYVKNKEEFNLSLNGYENTFSEIKILFRKYLEQNHSDLRNIIPFNETSFSISKLYDLAYESGKFSRFKLDEKFHKDQFERLYRIWVDNSINAKFADELLVYQENDQLLGFVSYKTNDNTATIGLIAVCPKSQGKGIGGKLLNYVEQKLAANNIKELIIPTQQANQAACSFYKKVGYEIYETTYIKHYWKDDTI